MYTNRDRNIIIMEAKLSSAVDSTSYIRFRSCECEPQPCMPGLDLGPRKPFATT